MRLSEGAARSGRTFTGTAILAMALASALVATLLVTGCSLPRSYYAVETESVRDLAVLDRYVKRIGVSRFENYSLPPHDGLATDFQVALSAALGRNCGKVELVDGRAPDAPGFLTKPPPLENGSADTYAIAQTARQEGFQVIIRGQLVSLRHRIDRSGWARFRESHHFLDLRLQAVAFNALTAVKIGQESQLISLPIDADTGAAIDAGAAVNLPELTAAVKETGVDLALKLCTPIRSHPWQTVVRKIQGADMVLAAHASAGLKAGDRLAVFDGSRVMTGGGGERFVMAGFRQGTLAVKSVTPTAVLAAGEESKTFPEGSILVPVR